MAELSKEEMAAAYLAAKAKNVERQKRRKNVLEAGGFKNFTAWIHEDDFERARELLRPLTDKATAYTKRAGKPDSRVNDFT